MKKILFISNIPAPYRIDFYNELGKYMDVTVLFEARGASDQGIKFNYNIETIKNFNAKFLSNGDIKENRIDWKIISFLRKNQYDEIVVTSYSYFTEMAAILYLKLFRKRYYMEIDGGIIRLKENKLKCEIKKMLISGAKGYFSPSQVADQYLKYYGAKESNIIRYPFTSLSEKEVLEKQSIDNLSKIYYRKKLGMEERIIILFVGQFIKRKGVDILLKATKYLPNDCGVYLVGANPEAIYLEMTGEQNNVHFIAFKKKEELSEYYKAADIFVLPTREDVWGLVINEAMSYGLPVITTDKCGAGLELIQSGNEGVIIRSDDIKALVDAIIELYNDEKKREIMSENSLRKIKNYTIEKMVKKHIEILE